MVYVVSHASLWLTAVVPVLSLSKASSTERVRITAEFVASLFLLYLTAVAELYQVLYNMLKLEVTRYSRLTLPPELRSPGCACVLC